MDDDDLSTIPECDFVINSHGRITKLIPNADSSGIVGISIAADTAGTAGITETLDAVELRHHKVQAEMYRKSNEELQLQHTQDVSHLAGMLYLFYKKQILDDAMGFDPRPIPNIIIEVRPQVDTVFDYYKGLSIFEFCKTFERIRGNGKELLESEPVTDTPDSM